MYKEVGPIILRGRIKLAEVFTDYLLLVHRPNKFQVIPFTQ